MKLKCSQSYSCAVHCMENVVRGVEFKFLIGVVLVVAVEFD